MKHGENSATAAARDLYLDLLVKSISNLIYGALPPDPWNDGLFRPDAAPGRNWELPTHSMVGLLRLENLRELSTAPGAGSARRVGPYHG